MAVSWRIPPRAAEDLNGTDPDNTDQDNTDERVRDGPEPDPEDTGILPAHPSALTDDGARRAALRELVLRALI